LVLNLDFVKAYSQLFKLAVGSGGMVYNDQGLLLCRHLKKISAATEANWIDRCGNLAQNLIIKLSSRR
jgi:hypothetical protein